MISSRYFSLYRVIRKSLRDFHTPRYSSRDGHAEVEHVNRGRETPSFCPTLQVLDMSTLGDAADVNPVIKFLPHTNKRNVCVCVCVCVCVAGHLWGSHVYQLRYCCRLVFNVQRSGQLYRYLAKLTHGTSRKYVS